MKKMLSPNRLPFFTLAAGILGLLLRVWLFATGMDEKGLLVSRHPGAILSWALAAAAMAVLFFCTRGLRAFSSQKTHKASAMGFIGSVIAAAGIAVTELSAILTQIDTFSLISGILGVVSSICLCAISMSYLKGKLPAFGLPCVVVVYFLFHLVYQYRLWSWTSQLQIYAFPLIASVFLMLSSYHRCAINTPLGNWGNCLFFSQTAALFCFLAIPGKGSLFYSAMAIWMLLTPCSLDVPVPNKEE